MRKKLMKMALSGVLLTSLSLPAVLSAAPVLSFGPSPTDFQATYFVGDSISLDVTLSGLTNVDLGGFEFDIAFDALPITYVSTTFGNDLFDSQYFGLQSDLLSEGVLTFSGVSLATDLSQQADSLHLLTLSFEAAAEGVSALSFANVLLTEDGVTAFGHDVQQAMLTIQNRVASPIPGPVPDPVLVSEPASVSYFIFMGMLMMGVFRKVKK